MGKMRVFAGDWVDVRAAGPFVSFGSFRTEVVCSALHPSGLQGCRAFRTQAVRILPSGPRSSPS